MGGSVDRTGRGRYAAAADAAAAAMRVHCRTWQWHGVPPRPPDDEEPPLLLGVFLRRLSPGKHSRPFQSSSGSTAASTASDGGSGNKRISSAVRPWGRAQSPSSPPASSASTIGGVAAIHNSDDSSPESLQRQAFRHVSRTSGRAWLKPNTTTKQSTSGRKKRRRRGTQCYVKIRTLPRLKKLTVHRGRSGTRCSPRISCSPLHRCCHHYLLASRHSSHQTRDCHQ
jgi:hypothetical protein